MAPDSNRRKTRSMASTQTVPAATASAPEEASLRHLPVGIFGASMGVFGFALALRAAGFAGLSAAMQWVGVAFFLLLAGAYATKAVLHPADTKAEWNHPVRIAFFPAISISVLLLATLLVEHQPGIATVLWMIGAAAHAVLTVLVVTQWIGHRPFQPMHLSPAWFIPAVGNVIVPLAGVRLGHAEISWYFLSVGLLFWIVLLTIVFNRLIFHDPMPGRLKPTMVILVAPPAVAFLAWLQLNGGAVDDFARILINIGYVFALIVAVQLPAILRLPFALSFWALSFPLAAIATASFRFAALTGSAFHLWTGYALLAALALAIVGLAVRTVQVTLAGQVFRPE